MGIEDILKTNGSLYTAYDGATPSINPLATKTSELHAKPTGKAGYSLDGTDKTKVQGQYDGYADGVLDILPAPSTLDVNGLVPTTALKDPLINTFNNTFSNGTYRKFIDPALAGRI
jgi:hypothetical protein